MKWQVFNLNQIMTSLESGSRPRGGAILDSEGIPSIGGEHIGNDGKVRFNNLKFIPKDYYQTLNKGQIIINDILIVKDGATTGKTAFVSNDFPFNEAAVNEHVFIVRLNSKVINPKYGFYWLFSSQGQLQILSDFRGSAQGGITRNFVSQVKIPLPPISEQYRIVEILDQADALRKMRSDADTKAERILPALFIKIFGDPLTWTDVNTEPLGSLVNIQSGGTPSKKNPDYWDGDIPWVSPKDMKQDVIVDSIDHISQKAIEETNIRYVEPGAILIVVRGMILAHTIPLAIAATRITINQDMKALYPNCSAIDSIYLHAALKASSRRILSQVGTAGHGTRKFDTDELLKLPILIPSQEQLRKFQLAVTDCRASLAGISNTKEKLDKLFNTLLERAFSGELTAKWREAHIKELLAEMEAQAKALNLRNNGDYQQLSML
ncbi:restriction endonuclease subunit S [Anabaena sp. CCY 9910]|uniref:restriction endonuclease subunit S n=1 Tax=Anabaena sp. CCY 9910 TaxID=3103870 RepID=UPI0039DFD571